MVNNILILNCGSQSIKWKIFDERLNIIKESKRVVFNQNSFKDILEEELKKIDRTGIKLIGHRVVHGKDLFRKTTQITEDNIKQLESISYLAPLHNPFNILGIKTCFNIFVNIPQFAVFDTEFFKDLPEKAYTYALPKDVVEEFGFRRYGFHGISHEYVAMKAAIQIKKPFNKLKIITCHLGGGASITAIKNGKVVDTSMGFTPMEGLVMMTRSGNIDLGIVLSLVKNFTLDRATDILTKESGIRGICGENDMLNVLERVKINENRAKLAFDIFVYSIQKYIGAYYAILGGCDLLVFTGSIGAGLKITRNAVCKDLNILKNPSMQFRTGTKILAIETDEELAIAKKVLNSIK